MNQARVNALIKGHNLPDELLQSVQADLDMLKLKISVIVIFILLLFLPPVIDHDPTPLYGATTVGKVISKGDIVFMNQPFIQV